MPVLERYLDNVELNSLGMARTQVTRFEGELDPDALAAAYNDVCARYPLLRAHVKPGDSGRLLSASPGIIPRVRIWDGDETTLRREISRPWDVTRALAELVLVRGRESFLALRTDIGVVDGRGWIAVYQELWRSYTTAVKGETLTIEGSGSLPMSPTAAASRWGAPPAATHPSSGWVPIIQFDDELDRLETQQLLAAARAHGVSLHGLVAGVTLVVHRGFGDVTTGPASMACMSAVDLRNRVTPPLGTTEVMKFVAFHLAQVEVTPESNPYQLGRDLKNSLDLAIADGRIPLDHPSLQIDTPLEPRLAEVAVSNVGVVDDIDHPPGVRITGWSRIITENRAYTLYGVYTFRGRLHVISAYPATLFSRSEVHALTSAVTQRLRELARDG